MIKESTYLEYQKLLASNKMIRAFWRFWSNHSFVFFIVAVIYIIANRDSAPYSYQAFILCIVAFLVARGFIVTIINALYERKRPYQAYGFIPITSQFFSFVTRTPNSFPSRHATVYFAVATVICLFVPPLGACLAAVSLLTGVARIVLGYHWPSDIVAGALLGIMVGYLTVVLGYPWLFT